MVYCIKGSPLALSRPRFNMARGTVYDCQRNERLIIGISLRGQHEDRPILKGPLMLYAKFYMPIPKNMKVEEGKTYHIVKPDLDNLIKLLLDVSTGVIIQDDKSIASVESSKIYSKDPRTEFYFKSLS